MLTNIVPVSSEIVCCYLICQIKSGKPWNDIEINRAKTFGEEVLIMISVEKHASSQMNVLQGRIHMKLATWQTNMAQGAVLNLNILQTISVKFYLRV